MRNIIAIVLFATIGSCAAGGTPIPEPNSADAMVYKERCAKCHSLPHPKRHTMAEWEHMIGVMEKRMEHKEMPPLSADEKSVIIGYLKRNSR